MLDRALTGFTRGVTHGVIMGGLGTFIGVSPYALWAGVLTWTLVQALLDITVPWEDAKSTPPSKS